MNELIQLFIKCDPSKDSRWKVEIMSMFNLFSILKIKNKLSLAHEVMDVI